MPDEAIPGAEPSELSATIEAPSQTLAPTLESGAEEFQPLDPRVVRLWRLHQLIFGAVFGGVLLVPLFMLGVRSGRWLWPLLGWLGIMGLLGIRLCWHPRRAYRAWGYRLDEKVLEIRQGIWFRTLTLLPLSRLQHVDLDAGPIERGLGLASLMFHTAGTQNAIILLPGLEASRARQLRDHLVAVGGDDAV